MTPGHGGCIGAALHPDSGRVSGAGQDPVSIFMTGIVSAPAGSETPGDGVVALILWALFITVTLKYVVILLRADNNGEGGTLTLMALASRAVGRFSKAGSVVALLGIISAALFYGDAVITPALPG